MSPDGARLLYTLAPRKGVRLRDMRTGTERDVDLPGMLRAQHWRAEESGGKTDGLAYGWLSDSLVLYEALPTQGQDPGYVPAVSMQGYYPKWTLKAADVDTLAFRTVIASVDGPVCTFGVGVLKAPPAPNRSRMSD
jgi:hypothetical protein